MNPFDLPGPQFLSLFAVLLFVAIGVAGYLRLRGRLPANDPPESPRLSSYETAYLGGGARRAVNAAIVRLTHAGALTVDPDGHTVESVPEMLPTEASPIEREVYAVTVRDSKALPIHKLHAEIRDELDPIRRRLEDWELLVSEDRAAAARFIPLMIVFAVIIVGVIKIFVGLGREKPVAFLVIGCIVASIATLIAFGRAVRRSRRGDKIFSRLRSENAALEHTASQRLEEFAADDMVLAMGLFGPTILMGSSLSHVTTALGPGTFGVGGGNGCGGGCGGGGGGCGGGGCGGCGG